MVADVDLPGWPSGLRSPLDEKLGVEWLQISSRTCVARCPVDGNTQPFGLWHGGASCVLAESLASTAAAAEVGPDGQVSGVDLNATHLRPATTGWITGTATALRIGGSTASYAVELVDDDGAVICAARVTVHLRRPRKD